jgi:predicted nucleic acid-binding protein
VTVRTQRGDFHHAEQSTRVVPPGMRWSEVLAWLRASGRAMPIKDSLMAATALGHGLTIATRDRTDFEKAGVRIVDPFAARSAT